MFEIDLEEFVTSGTFGSLGRAPARESVLETLGQPDSSDETIFIDWSSGCLMMNFLPTV